MSEGPSHSTSHLEPPGKGVEMEDPGAKDNDSNSDEDHFSDASEGHTPRPQSRAASPVPRTRVERVDSSAQHGDVPGTSAYTKREQDAVPDEMEVIPEGSESRNRSRAGLDLVAPESASANPTVPETRLSQVDAGSDEEGTSQPRVHHRRSPSDALPDTVETISDNPEPQASLPKSRTIPSHVRRKASLTGNPEDSGGVGGDEDFDEFVEEQDDMGDDFGDFDDGFQDPSVEVAEEAPTEGSITPQQPQVPPSVPPLTEFDTFKSTSELLNALNGTLDNLFPASKDLGSFPLVEPIPDSAAIFSSERSLSLWSQLVAPPPLQPQNWVKSRIRRLFLVSLGVPVDLDEILPASKQKKLILPSIDLEVPGATNPRRGPAQQDDGSQIEGAAAAAGVPGQAPPTRHQKTNSRRRAPSPPPEIDLSAVRRLCTTTDAALSGLTDAELKIHIGELEQVTKRASTVLEYWLKRRDGLVSEKEAFEGVIENLVSHARRVRK